MDGLKTHGKVNYSNYSNVSYNTFFDIKAFDFLVIILFIYGRAQLLVFGMHTFFRFLLIICNHYFLNGILNFTLPKTLLIFYFGLFDTKIL